MDEQKLVETNPIDVQNNDVELPAIAPLSHVRVTAMNHIVEVQYMQKMNRKNNIRKLDKDRYVDLRTGEIKDFEHIENRQGSLNSLRQTFKKLRYLINANFLGQGNELHVTLTYEENMTDTKRLYADFKRFMTRFRRYCADLGSLDYLSVVEPQGRGAWHFHLLLRFNDVKKVYIENSKIAELWEQGYVKTKSMKDIDNIGAYLSAYLADIELDAENLTYEDALAICNGTAEVVTKTVEGQEKKFIKGGRLYLYPSGMNLYRKSKGIAFPERLDMRYKDIKKIVGSAKPHYSRTYIVDDEDFQNEISFIQYNLKR